MATTSFKLEAQSRSTIGKGASRRLRRLEGQVPAILYGGKEAPMPLTLIHKDVKKVLENEAAYSQILTLVVDNKPQQAILKDLQRHPYKPSLLHMDFQRVEATDVVTMHIPVHFINEEICPGVKSGGIINHHAIDVEIRCQAGQLPEFINVDLQKLEVDQAIHLSELNLPEGAEIPVLHQGKDYDAPVVSVHLPRQAKETSDTEASEAGEGDTATDSDKA